MSLALLATSLVFLYDLNRKGLGSGHSTGNLRILELCTTVDQSPDLAFSSWGSADALEGWMAKDVTMDPLPGGKLKVGFSDPGEPYIGTGNLIILAYEAPHRMLFSWDAPKEFPHVRTQRTVVELQFIRTDAETTLVRLIQTGWGRGAEWDATYDYFISAWSYVLKQMPGTPANPSSLEC